jgi:hypothetical protein
VALPELKKRQAFVTLKHYILDAAWKEKLQKLKSAQVETIG